MLVQIQSVEGFVNVQLIVSVLSSMAKFGFLLLVGFFGLLEHIENLFTVFDDDAGLVDDGDGLAELDHVDVQIRDWLQSIGYLKSKMCDWRKKEGRGNEVVGWKYA
jgi:hypothetical protein